MRRWRQRVVGDAATVERHDDATVLIHHAGDHRRDHHSCNGDHRSGHDPQARRHQDHRVARDVAGHVGLQCRHRLTEHLGQAAYVNITFAPALAGYAILDSVVYGDISGDGFDEAIITVYSGGTAGNTGVLVYQLDAANKLSLVGPNDFYTSFGYKAYGQVDKGDLVVGNVVSAGWEPNCCQSGYVERRFRIVGGRMTQQGQSVEAGYLAARSNTIEQFYSMINAKKFDAAYQFTTPAFQAREPFDKWKAGYATTKSVEAQATSTEQAGPVKFKLTAVDSTASGDLTRTYTGVWTLVYSAAKHQWLLDTAEVQLGG